MGWFCFEDCFKALIIFPDLSSVASDGKDKPGLKLKKKNVPTFSSFNAKPEVTKGVMVSAAG